MKSGDIPHSTGAGQLTSHVKLLQKAVVEAADGKIVMLQRSHTALSRPGCWDLPGGNSEWPTDDQIHGLMRGLHVHDVLREISEETGLQLSPDDFPDAPVYVDTTFEVDKQVYTIIVGWWLRLTRNSDEITIQLSSEHQACRWISKSQALTLDFGFAGGKNGFLTQIISHTF